MLLKSGHVMLRTLQWLPFFFWQNKIFTVAYKVLDDLIPLSSLSSSFTTYPTLCSISLASLLFLYQGFPGCSDGKESASSAGNLGWEDPLEKAMATRSSIFAWRIP